MKAHHIITCFSGKLHPPPHLPLCITQIFNTLLSFLLVSPFFFHLTHTCIHLVNALKTLPTYGEVTATQSFHLTPFSPSLPYLFTSFITSYHGVNRCSHHKRCHLDEGGGERKNVCLDTDIKLHYILSHFHSLNISFPFGLIFEAGFWSSCACWGENLLNTTTQWKLKNICLHCFCNVTHLKMCLFYQPHNILL